MVGDENLRALLEYTYVYTCTLVGDDENLRTCTRVLWSATKFKQQANKLPRKREKRQKDRSTVKASDAAGERASSLASAANASSAPSMFALRAARLTVSARLTARLAVVFATARRRARCSAAVKGIPATRPPSDQ